MFTANILGTKVSCLFQCKYNMFFSAQSIAVRPNEDHVPVELELDAVNGGIDCPMCNPTCSKTAYSYDFNNVLIYPEYLNSVADNDRDDWL